MAAIPRFPSARPTRPRAIGLISLIAMLALVAGCATGAGFTPLPSITVQTAAPVPTATPATFPLTVTDDEGTTVTIPSKPTKIVSLTPASTEILFAIGAGPRVAATTDFDDYPPEALRLPHVASFTSVDSEKIVGLGADLVIAGGNGFNPPDAIAKLRSLNIPVVVTYGANVAGVLADIRLVGEASGASEAANALASTMGAGFDAIRAATASSPHPKVFYELDATGKIYTAAKDSFVEEMLQIAGADPVTTGSTTAFDIPLETLISDNPSLILLGDAAYGVTAAQVEARAGWGTIDAVKTGSIVGVNDTLITRPGPRLVLGLIDLVRAIHPELTLPAGLPTPEPDASSAPAGSAAP